MKIEAIHHVSLGVTDLERSRQFYREILRLEEIERPPFNFPGAWFSVGASQQLHLIVHPNSTFRTGKGLGYARRAFRHPRRQLPADGGLPLVEGLSRGGRQRRAQTADPAALCDRGASADCHFDPDRNVIEINAAELD